MAAGRMKFLLIISVWFLALSYAFELGKHCKLHVRTSKVPFAVNSITPWIKGSILCRNWLKIRRSGNYLKSRVNYYSNCSATFNLDLLRLCVQKNVLSITGLWSEIIKRLGVMAAVRGLTSMWRRPP